MRKKRQSPKRSCKVELDRISNLPCDIIEKVLAHLPIKEAVRTSVLSRKWRYKSARLGHLVFDRQCFSALKDASFVNIVDRVLLHHIGPIQKFKLSNTGFSPTCDIDRWILQLSRSSIKELILEIWIVNRNNRYRLPSCLYSCAVMVHLELLECLLQPPLTFKGFGSLKSLDLQHVTVSQAVFENIILGCPLLEKLTLINFDGFTDLNIDAPNLQIFDVGGNFQDVNFKNTSNLAVVSVGLYDDIVCSYKKRGLGVSSNLVKFFAHLPSIQRLEIQSHFLKYLAIGVLPVELPGPCLALSYLSLRISFNHSDEISAALCLLKSCPALQELEIGVRSSDRHVAKRAKFQLDVTWTSPLAKLRLVKVNGISGMKPELEFLKLLLFSSPMLERMTVKPFDDIYAWEIVKELLLFKRASTHAEIAYLDP